MARTKSFRQREVTLKAKLKLTMRFIDKQNLQQHDLNRKKSHSIFFNRFFCTCLSFFQVLCLNLSSLFLSLSLGCREFSDRMDYLPTQQIHRKKRGKKLKEWIRWSLYLKPENGHRHTSREIILLIGSLSYKKCYFTWRDQKRLSRAAKQRPWGKQ